MPGEPDRSRLLVGNIYEARGIVTTVQGDREVVFRGSVGFRVLRKLRGMPGLRLIRLNLVTDGIATEEESTGVIGLRLLRPEVEVKVQPDGRFESAFTLILHYPLIDSRLGFRQQRLESRVIENDCFIPFTEQMSGTLSGQLAPGFAVGNNGTVQALMDVDLRLSRKQVGTVIGIRIKLKIDIDKLQHATEVLPIQPIFIGSNTTDSTGKAFDELMKHACSMWGRCGSERCLSFQVLQPIYLNKQAYREVNDEAEMESLSLECLQPDAIEVIMADHFSTALAVKTGGGATYSSGTAAARIVTCDQQLDVPSPPPCGSGSSGAVNFNHLAHELGHVLGLFHPYEDEMNRSTVGSLMEPSGFCRDNPSIQSAKNCRNAANPLLRWGRDFCLGSPDIMD